MEAKLITPSQARYIRILIAENADRLDLLNEVSKAVVRVVQGEGSYPVQRRLASKAIDDLRGLADLKRQPTERQVQYLTDLAVNKGVRDQLTETVLAKLTYDSASKLIDALKKMEDVPVEQAGGQRSSHNPNGVTDGMYQTPSGEIYKVQVAVHGSGKLYGKKLVPLTEPRQLRNGVRTHEFVKEDGALRKLTPAMAMTQEQAAAFGKLYGACCNCGLTLTDETSIELGIGPKCRAKRGWM